MQYQETGYLLLHQTQKYPIPLTFEWRVQHSIGYLIGGTTFVIGSLAYFPWIANYSLGGWMFTIGSIGFLYADLKEWWMNNKVGCAFDNDYLEDYEKFIGHKYGPPHTCWGVYMRKENGLNFAFSSFGSLLYLVGSIMFIPRFDAVILGTYVFIDGSLVIFLSQSWKVIRQGMYSDSLTDLTQRSFAFSNYCADLTALGVDAFAGLGGFAYMIGSIYFLPQNDVSDTITIAAVTWFTVGGVCFTISGLFILYRYFCTLNYYH